MMYLACYTTRSERILRLNLLLSCFVLPFGVAHGQVKDGGNGPEASLKPADTLAALFASNNLEAIDKRPFHLKFSFQVFTPEGKTGEEGHGDLQWSGTGQTHVEVSSPKLGTLTTLSDSSLGIDAQRELFLVRYLVDSLVHPGTLLHANGTIFQEDRKAGETTLHCFKIQQSRPGDPPITEAVVCSDARGAVRSFTDRTSAFVKNRPAVFAGSEVGLDSDISLGGRPVIKGHIDDLRTLPKEPVDSSTQSKQEKGTAESATQAHPGDSGIQAGVPIHKTSPVYPLSARQNGISGVVVLGVTIGQDGKIAQAVPLASPDASLTDAAVQCVQQWSYQPYLVDGVPTEVNTVVTVNFNLSRSSTLYR